jgi:hypothetical protein
MKSSRSEKKYRNASRSRRNCGLRRGKNWSELGQERNGMWKETKILEVEKVIMDSSRKGNRCTKHPWK